MTTPHAQTAIQWTLVARKRGARFFRPIENAPVGTWHEASEAANSDSLRAVSEGFEVWYVPAQGEPVHAEDLDNVLVDSGKRYPIRWDAESQITLPVVDLDDTMTAEESEEYVYTARESFPDDHRLVRLVWLVKRRLEAREDLWETVWVEAGLAARAIVQDILEFRIEAKRIARRDNGAF